MTDKMLTPVGRIVSGSVHEGNAQTWDGKPRPLKADGTPDIRWFVGLAIPKADPGWNAIHAMIVRAAQAGNPCMVGADGKAMGPFSWKITDGDSQVANQKGNRPCDQEGNPGHWILGLNTSFPISCWNARGEVIPASAIQRGYYAVASVSAVPNNATGNQAGVYVNVHGLKLHAEGPIIQVGPGFADLFGSAPTTAPPSAPPLSVYEPPPVAAVAPPPPDPAFVAAAPASEPQPPAGFRMNGPHSYAAMIGNGWTDETLKAGGHMGPG